MAQTIRVTNMIRHLVRQENWIGNVSVLSSRVPPTLPLPTGTTQPNARCLSCSNNIRGGNSASTASSNSDRLSTSKVLYDGDCKICQIEISALKKWTEKRDNIEFVDISKPDYDPQQWGGVSYEDAMKEMHVVGPNGKVYTQGDAIRHMYRACGLGFLSTLTELPLVRPMCDELYVHFARYRLRKALDRCDSNSCDIKLKHLRDKLEGENKT